MTLQVIGAGFGRTGTNSLKLALEELGFGPCHHMFQIRDHPEQLGFWQAAACGETPNWDQVFEGYKAQVDWPGARYWRELAAHFPNAKVILSVRPEESWFKSVMATIYPSMAAHQSHESADRRARSQMAFEAIVQQTFDGRMDDHDHAIAVFRRHITDVQSTIAPDRLLTHRASDGWEPLCRFLGTAVPATPFPRANTTEAFRTKVAGGDQRSR
jgi:hypothetical protein